MYYIVRKIKDAKTPLEKMRSIIESWIENQHTSIKRPPLATIQAAMEMYNDLVKNKYSETFMSDLYKLLIHCGFENKIKKTQTGWKISLKDAADDWYTLNNGKLIIKEGTREIPDEFFSDKSISSVVLPNSLKEIGRFAFDGNNLTSIDIPGNVVIIGEGAFANNRLTSVDVPGGVMEIGFSAFADNNITYFAIPERYEDRVWDILDIESDDGIEIEFY